MKPKQIAAIVAAMAVIAAVMLVAAEKGDGKSEPGIYRLKSHGQVVAEIRVVAPGKMQVSPTKIDIGGGRTTWHSDEAGKPVTFRLLVDRGQPVVFTAEEIELDRELDLGLNKKIEKK